MISEFVKKKLKFKQNVRICRGDNVKMASPSFWHNFVVANHRDFQFVLLYVLYVFFDEEYEYRIRISMRSIVLIGARFLFRIKYKENIRDGASARRAVA